MFEDKTLVCKDCGNEFTFTAGEQEFYAEKGFENEPSRCKLAVTLRSQESGSQKSISQQLVQLAAGKLKFLLSQARTDLYIAVIALLK